MEDLAIAYVTLRDARRRILQRFGIKQEEFWEADRVRSLVEAIQNKQCYEIDFYLEDTLRNYIRICYDNIAEVLIASIKDEEKKKQLGLNFIYGAGCGRRAERQRKPDGKMIAEFYKEVVEKKGAEGRDNIILKRLESVAP